MTQTRRVRSATVGASTTSLVRGFETHERTNRSTTRTRHVGRVPFSSFGSSPRTRRRDAVVRLASFVSRRSSRVFRGRLFRLTSHVRSSRGPKPGHGREPHRRARARGDAFDAARERFPPALPLSVPSSARATAAKPSARRCIFGKPTWHPAIPLQYDAEGEEPMAPLIGNDKQFN